MIVALHLQPAGTYMDPPGLALLAAPTWLASQVLCAALECLALLPSGMIEVIRHYYACQLAVGFIGEGRMA
jgi:hypothetical protein